MKAEAIIPSIRTAVQRIDRDLPLLDIRTQRQQIDVDLQQERIFATLSSGFGLLALMLACVGIYGIWRHGCPGPIKSAFAWPGATWQVRAWSRVRLACIHRGRRRSLGCIGIRTFGRVAALWSKAGRPAICAGRGALVAGGSADFDGYPHTAPPAWNQWMLYATSNPALNFRLAFLLCDRSPKRARDASASPALARAAC